MIINALPPPAGLNWGSVYGKNPFSTLKNVNAFHRSPLNNCKGEKRRAWSLPFLLLTAMFVWFSTSTSLAQIIATFDVVDAICENGNGTITCVSITGGTAPYTCSINCQSCVNVGTVWLNVEPGDYIATITDFTGLQAFATVNVGHDFPEPITLSVTTIPSACNGSTGSGCAVATGGTGSFTYEWVSQTQPNVILSSTNCLNNVPASIYELTVDDSNSPCSKVFPVEILQSTLTLTSTVTNTQCAGADCQGNVLCTGSMTLVPAGTAPYTVMWSDGFVGNGLTRTGMCPGTYTATVTDANGCSASVTNTIAITGAQLLPNAVPSGVANLGTLPAVSGFPSSASTHFITANTNWNPAFFSGLNSIVLACNIVVMPGVQLNISDLVVKLPQGSTIRLMPTARLIANGSTFEPGCGTTWRGFEIFGAGAMNAPQRGYLELNGCKVTQASIALNNFQFAANLSVPQPFHAATANTTSGGKVKATSTQFIDNIIDAHIAQIAVDAFGGSSCEFNDCLFSIDQLPVNCDGVDYEFQAMARGRVLLNVAQNVLFFNCFFENINTANLGPVGAAWNFPALRTNGSSYRIGGNPSTTASNYVSGFSGFTRGIVSFNSYAPGFVPTDTTDFVSIENTRFQCFNGLDCNSLRRSSYIGNWLEDLPAGFTHVTNNSTTLLSRFLTQLKWSPLQTPSFLYEGNTHVNTQADVASVGLLLQNGGPRTNYVVGNYFRGMSNAGGISTGGVPDRASAIVFGGRNRAGTVGTGVRYECNTFENNLFDTFVTWGGVNVAWSVIGPASIQRGSWPVGQFPSFPVVSAGNKFTNSISGVNQDDITYTTAVDAQPFFGNGVCQYWYHPTELSLTNGINEMTPSYSWPLNVLPFGGQSNSCLYAVESPQLSLEVQNMSAGLFINQRDALVEMTSAIPVSQVTSAASAEQVWSLYETVSSNVGALSDETLIALAEALDFPTLLLLDILAMEAGAGRNERLLEVIAASGRSLSEADWNEIIESKTLTSSKTTMEQQLADTKAFFDGCLWLLSAADYAKWEQATLNGTSLSLQLPFEAACASDKLLAFGQPLLPIHEQYTQAEFDKYNMSTAWQEYLDWQQLRLEVLQRPDRAFTTEETEALMYYFYSDPMNSGFAAYALLNEFGTFEEDPYRFSQGEQSTRMTSSDFAGANQQQDVLLFPNPCLYFTTIQDENFRYLDAAYVVRSMDGKEVTTGSIPKGRTTFILDTASLPEGVYQLEVTFANARTTQRTTKFIKQ